MKPTITRFNDKTGDFEITIPVPFTLKDGIEYADMIVVDIPKYEDTKDYNVFDLIRENQDLKKQFEDMTLCRDIASGHRKEVQDREIILLNQQKKFIEWLEDKINFWKDKIFENAITENDWTLTLWRNKLGILEESLSKYKEIIGVKDE